MPTLFSRIIAGEIPCHKVAESDHFFAFLDISPLTMGHTLVVPKLENDYIFDLDEATYLGLMAFSRQVAKGVEQVVACKRIGVAVVGLEVPHTHVHLVPIDRVEDMNFRNIRVAASDVELADIAQKISEAIKAFL